MQNELNSQPPNIPYYTVLIDESSFVLSIETTEDIIQDLQQKIEPSKQDHFIEYQDFAESLHSPSVFHHDRHFDAPSSDWAWPLEMNKGNYNETFRKNRSMRKFNFRGQP